MRSGFAAQAAGFRAERKIVAHTGTPLANDLRDDRYRDFLWCFGADIEPERRMNFIEQYRVYTVLCQPRQHRARAALRANHTDEASGLPQRSAYHLFVEGVAARD